MNYSDLEKIELQLEKYNLTEEIPNISKWLVKLNKKQIDNFLSLNISNLGKLENYKYILVNLGFLNKDNYLKVVNKLVNNNSEVCIIEIIKLLLDSNFIESKYYNEDIEILLDEGKCFNIEALCTIARSGKSVGSNYHLDDIKLIAITNDINKLRILTRLACNNTSLNGKYHKKDMETVFNIDGISRLEAIEKLACSNNSVNSIYHDNDVKLIITADESKIPYLVDVACDPYSVNSKEHINDMNLIYTSKTNRHAEYLEKLALSITSLFSHFHNEHMKLLFNTSEEKLPFLFHLLNKHRIVQNPMNSSYLIFISNCNNIKKVECMSKIMLNEKLEKEPKKRKEILDIIKNIENEFVLDLIMKFIDSTTEILYYFICSIKDVDKIEDVYEIKNYVLKNMVLVYNELQDEEKTNKITNKEKIEIIKNNSISYKDSDRQLPTIVFKTKVKEKIDN